MTSKKFVKKTLLIIIGIIIFVISTNIYINEFGLFGNVKNKQYRVYVDEKTTKYLYSFNYIPSNFDGILVGPSLSDQMMNTQKIENHKIYNLSMDGGNISELKFAIDNVLKFGNIKTFIICLDPYITKNSGTKSSQINKKEYYGSLGSLFIIKYYVKKYLEYKKMGTNSIYYDSYWGYTDNEYAKKDEDSTLNINKNLSSLDNNNYDYSSLKIDKVAYNELKEVIERVRKNNIKIVAYYYPTPKKYLNIQILNYIIMNID